MLSEEKECKAFSVDAKTGESLRDHWGSESLLKWAPRQAERDELCYPGESAPAASGLPVGLCPHHRDKATLSPTTLLALCSVAMSSNSNRVFKKNFFFFTSVHMGQWDFRFLFPCGWSEIPQPLGCWQLSPWSSVLGHALTGGRFTAWAYIFHEPFSENRAGHDIPATGLSGNLSFHAALH